MYLINSIALYFLNQYFSFCLPISIFVFLCSLSSYFFSLFDWMGSFSFFLFFLHVSSVQFSCSVMSDSLRPHELQHARPPCPSPTPGVHSSDLAWRIPWTGEPGGLPSMGLRRVGHNWSDLAAAAVATHWLNNCNLLALGHAGFSLRHKGSLVVSSGCRACSFSSYGIQA